MKFRDKRTYIDDEVYANTYKNDDVITAWEKTNFQNTKETRVFWTRETQNNALRTLQVRVYSFEHDYYVLRQNKLAETNERTLVYEVKLR